VTAPAVSVVVPVYNGGSHLAAAIESILSQEHRPFDIIVVDDGSTDATPSVIAGFSDRLVSVRQDNGGPGAARNAGTARATAPFVAFLDADDLWLPATLTHQLACLEADSEAAVAWGLSDRRVDPGTVAPRDDWHGRPQWALCVGSMLFRRSVLEEVGGFDATLWGGEDMDLMVRLSEQGVAVRRHPNMVHIRRFHGQNQFALDDLAMKRAHFRVVSKVLARRRLPRDPARAAGK
jgi:glycosyltransferase involved in cell wall biosynthesis